VPSWSSSFELLLSTNSSQTLTAIILDKYPAELITDFIDNEAAGEPAMLYSALTAVPWLTLSNYVEIWSIYPTTITVTHTVYENVLKNQRIHLSSHHLYGSSRLGTKDYKPGQHYMYWDYAGPTVIADTSSLTTRRPWYSMVYNDAVQGLALSPYGMTDASRYQVQHLAGQKQYELSNHLGNVQATVSDLPVKVGEAHTEYHAPALPAVYDYYPFGMLMPDRYTSDTSSECVTVSQTKWVTTWVTHCYLAADWIWPAYSYYGTVSVSTGSGLQIAASESSGVYFEMDVLPYEQQDVYLQTDAFYSGSGTLELQEYHGGQWMTLGSATFDKIGEVRISIRPREDRIRAVLRGPFYVQVKQFCVQRPQLSQETVLVDICDTDGDKYRFGFNGQEKVNEWAGVGNHLDFTFRGYDSRTGRFISLDPLQDLYPWNSPYAFAENRVIDGIDLEGKEWENFKSKFKNPGELKVKVPNEKTAQKQHYRVNVQNSQKTFSELKDNFKSAPQNLLSNSKAKFFAPVDGDGKPTQFKVGSYIKIDIDGPSNNGYVKVKALEDTKNGISATFVTMEGHMEKGIINFSITDKGKDGIEFQINSTSEVDQGSAKAFAEGFSRDKQKESWDEVLTNFVETTGGEETSRSTEVGKEEFEGFGGGQAGGAGAGGEW
jgi:RHS repeat-associated protein